MQVDAAVHVYADDPSAFPWAPIDGAPVPAHRAPVDELVAEQGAGGWHGAVCIQPRAYGRDHRFLASVLAARGDRFAGVCLVHPTAPDGPAELRRRVLEEGFAGVRLLAFTERTVAWLAGATGDPLWEEAGQLGVSVSVLARSDQLADLADRARRHPRITVVIDHMAMIVAKEYPTALRHLLACAEVDNIWVKLSSLGYLSRTPWPYEDLHPMLGQLIAAFGPERAMIGTDWPNSRKFGPYGYPLDALDRAVDLDERARALVVGENARKLFRVGHRAGGDQVPPSP